MFPVPLTFLFDFGGTIPDARPSIMHELAANGVKHLVLSNELISMILQSRGTVKKLKSEMTAEGLDFVDAHAPFGRELDLNCNIPVCRKQLILRHKLHLAIAAEMGVDTITIHIGNDHQFPEVPLEEQLKNVKDALAQLLPVAEEYGVAIAIENIWFRINTPENLLSIKADFPTDYLGFCYDAGHANLMSKGYLNPESNPFSAWKAVGVDTPAWDDHILEKMLPYIINTHLHDNDGVWDLHKNIGTGTVDWKHVIPLLITAPKLKNMQSEVIPMRTHTAICDLVRAFDELQKL